MSSEKQLPPIPKLLEESWVTLKATALSLVKLSLLSYFVTFCAVVVMGVLWFALIFNKIVDIQKGTNVAASLLNPAFIVPNIVLFVLFVVVLSLISIASVAAQALIIYSGKKLAVVETLKKGLTFFVPLILVSLLSWFMLVGSMFFFAIPFILFAFLLMFINFEVILNNQRPFMALQRSVTLVLNNFFEVLLRVLLLVVGYVGIVYIIPQAIYKYLPETAGIVVILSFVINILVGWYAQVYMVVLYKHVQKKSEDEKTRSITWMWVVSIIGWIIAIIMVVSVWRLVTSPVFIDAFTSAFTKESVKNMKNVSVTPGMYDTESNMMPTTVPVVQNQKTAPAANCTQYNIREGEFASNKCYSAQDYNDLLYYGQRFNSAVFNYNAASNSISVTCSGSDFFKAQCEQDQKDKATAESEMEKYRTTIKEIIARGK